MFPKHQSYLAVLKELSVIVWFPLILIAHVVSNIL
jgi:hypothetical protein